MMNGVPRGGGADLDTGVYDETYDVVVAGYGFAGGITAIEAADAGAKVLICEKMPDPGGLSICSGGSIRCAYNADEAFAYLTATNSGTTPDDVLRVLADGMTKTEAYIDRLLSTVKGAARKPNENSGRPGGNYPFPGWQTFHHAQVVVEGGLDRTAMYPGVRTRPSSGGPEMFWLINQHIQRRGVEVRLNTPVLRLIRSADNEVRGVVIGASGNERRVAARRAVVLACGGFEWDDEMKRQYWEGKPVLTASSRGNTGDGIRMAQALGAELWHMWHFHGSYAFKHPDPDFPFALRVKRLPDWNPAMKDLTDVKIAWIVVDQHGRRYMNECPPYAQDTSHRPMHHMDAETMTYPRIPSWLLTDWNGHSMYQLADVRTNDREYIYDWSPDNSKELKNGILKQAESIEALAAMIGADARGLHATIDRWNALYDNGGDADFGRPYGTMVRIDTPPFVFGAVYPTVSNTQGGPVHNVSQQIIDVAGRAIPRLYAAGELGSSYGHLYLSGGNLAECFVTGWIAGKEAAAQSPWR
jgi:succinate dehydrogenase/fumarate reductase flavoprotein subunit